MTTAKILGGRRRPKNNSRQNKNKQQHGGSCDNSSSTAALYGGVTPMINNLHGGAALDPANFNNVATPTLVAGNGLVSGLSVPSMMKGGAAVPMVGAGTTVPMVGAGATVPSMIKGGGVLNNIAVPAVLLYANNTFGKKRGVQSKKNRRFRKKSYNKRTNRKRR
jgi:hypothetical protein